MPEDLIRYDILAQEALRGVVRKVLAEVSRTGLPGNHHFYITFGTRAPGVRISTPLLNTYPEEMTIVLQYAFRDLVVSEHAFEVGLSFGDVPERLLIPFSAIRAFLDPSVQFALHFDPRQQVPEIDAAPEPSSAADKPRVVKAPAGRIDAKVRPKSVPATGDKGAEKSSVAKGGKEPALPSARENPATPGVAEVVSLDAFRKKN